MHSIDDINSETSARSTQMSLIGQLHNWQDKRSWNEFYRKYHMLVYSVARKAGLSETEAWDAVQETFVTIARQSLKGVYDPAQGSFKSWLLHVAHWRINDQLRKRSPQHENEGLSNMPTLDDHNFDSLWQREWQQNLLRAAITRIKQKVSPRQFQIFDFHVLQGMPTDEVARKLGVNPALIYLAKHRVGQQLRHEIENLRKGEG